jgi:hypothetical protein
MLLKFLRNHETRLRATGHDVTRDSPQHLCFWGTEQLALSHDDADIINQPRVADPHREANDRSFGSQ